MEELLNELGGIVVKIIQQAMAQPRPRFSKRGNMPKGTYNFVASKRLQQSVNYVIMDDELIIVMEDYGVEYVFSDLAEAQTGGEGGSWPGGGKFYPDSRAAGAKGKYSPLLAALEKWIKDKGIQPRNARGRFIKRKSMAFAIRTKMFKAGWKGLPLFTEQLLNEINNSVERLLQEDRYAEIAADEILEKVENLRVFGQTTYNLTIE